MDIHEAIERQTAENRRRIEVIEKVLQNEPGNKECIKNMNVLRTISQLLFFIEQFLQIGTFDECREAMEKQIPKKPSVAKTGYVLKGGAVEETEISVWACPNCKDTGLKKSAKYCSCCGQRILFDG